jgi:ribosomal RNA-processing protein 17
VDDMDDADENWQGISPEDDRKDKEEEYEGEEQLATVTIIEDFDPTELMHGPTPEDPSGLQFTPLDRNQEPASLTALRKGSTPGQTSKKIHCETKASRPAGRKQQQQNRKSQKAVRSRAKSRKGNRGIKAKGSKRR